MRELSAPVLQRCQVKQGTSPILIVAIYWGEGFRFFSTKTLTINGIYCEGRILNMSGLNNRRTANCGSNVATIGIELDDNDGLLKTLMDASQSEKAPCGIYQTFDGLGSMTLLMKGRVCGPIKWSEGSRILSLNLEAEVEAKDVGFCGRDLPDGAIKDAIIDDKLDVPWPLIFGKCANVPATQIVRQGVGKLRRYLKLFSDIGVEKSANVFDFNRPCSTQEFDDTTGDVVTNTFEVDGGSNFPQNKDIKIIISGVKFIGQFSGDTFTVNSANVPIYESLKIDTNSLSEGDKSATNECYKTLQLVTTDFLAVSLVNMYCEVNFHNTLQLPNLCTRQELAECWFRQPFINPKTRKPSLITTGSTIAKAYNIPPNGLVLTTTFDTLLQLATDAITQPPARVRLLSLINTLKSSDNIFWDALPGTEVREVPDKNDTEKYVISSVPMTTITGVFVHSTEVVNGKDVKIFQPVPKDFWTIKLQDADYPTLNGIKATTIAFHRPLKEMLGVKVEDQIYISGTSSVGPSPVDIIEWIIKNYTEYDIDNISFNNTRSHVDDTNFAIFEKINAIRFAQDIAWQSRCGLIQDMGNIYLKYLPIKPSPIMIFDETNIEMKTLNFDQTQTTEIFTECVARWFDTYKFMPQLNKQNLNKAEAELFNKISLYLKLNEIDNVNYEVYKNNINLFGLKSRSFDFYIYNTKDLVVKSLTYWGKRFSNSWRMVSFKTFMPAIILQVFDGVQINLGFSSSITSTSLLGLVDSINYDFKDKSFDVKIWLPSVAGTIGESSDAWE